MTSRERKAITWIRKKGSVTAQMMVEWDERTPGPKFFEWDEARASHEWRLQQARFWLNKFRTKINGFRVRSFIHFDENEEMGIQDGYVHIEEISANPTMRQAVIRDITKRMANLAAELKLWKLSEDERADILKRVSAAME